MQSKYADMLPRNYFLTPLLTKHRSSEALSEEVHLLTKVMAHYSEGPLGLGLRQRLVLVEFMVMVSRGWSD